MKKGDIITVVSVMTPEVVYTFYAADLLGATLNLVDPRYSVEGIREYIEEVESRLLICLNVVYPRCHQAAKRTSVERVVVLSPADSLPLAKAVGYKLTEPDKNRYASNVLRWKAFIAAGKGHSPAAAPYDPQHTCVVVHTGGTTGSPKGVMLTDYCFNALAQEFAAQSRLFHRGQKLLNVMPPSSPTVTAAASTCRWSWGCISSSSPIWTRISWAHWCGSTSPRTCSACPPTTNSLPPTRC